MRQSFSAGAEFGDTAGVAILTTDEAAALVGVAPATVQSWVRRGYLTPIRRNAKPVRFREVDVVECRYQRMRQTEHDTLDAIWAQVVAGSQ